MQTYPKIYPKFRRKSYKIYLYLKKTAPKQPIENSKHTQKLQQHKNSISRRNRKKEIQHCQKNKNEKSETGSCAKLSSYVATPAMLDSGNCYSNNHFAPKDIPALFGLAENSDLDTIVGRLVRMPWAVTVYIQCVYVGGCLCCICRVFECLFECL